MQLALLEFTITDPLGNALASASVEVRKQGAQVSGSHSPGNPITVDDVGAIVDGDNVRLNASTSPTRVATILSATSIDCGLGFTAADDDRLTCITPITVYEDALANTTKANALTTDAQGRAWCYVVGGKYDALLSHPDIPGGSRLAVDVPAIGGEITRCNAYNSGTAVAVVFDTLRTFGVADTLFSLRNAAVDKFKVMGDGEVQAGAAGADHFLTGSLRVTEEIDVDGTATIGGMLTVEAGGASITGTVTVAGATGNIQQTGTLTPNAFAAATGFTGNVTVSGSGKSLTVSGTGGLRNSGGGTRLDGGGLTHGPWISFADADTTPDVSGGNFFVAANTSPTTITRFDGLVEGEQKVIYIRHTNSNTTYARTAAQIRTSAATVNPTQHDVIVFVQAEDVSPPAMNQLYTVPDIS